MRTLDHSHPVARGGAGGAAANGGDGATPPHDAGNDSSAGDAGRGGAGTGGSAGHSGNSGVGGHQAGAGAGAGTGGSAGRGGSSGVGGSVATPPACGTIGTASNNLVVTVNGVEHHFSDATVRFEYLGEGYHSIGLQKADVSVALTLTASTYTDCPAVRALPASASGVPWVGIRNTAGNVIKTYSASLPGAAGTFTMIGCHVTTSPSHRTLGVAFSCDNCILPEMTAGPGGEDGGSSSAEIHGEVHLLNQTP